MRTTLILLLVLSASVFLHAGTRAIPVPTPDSLVMTLTGLATVAGFWRWKKLGR